MKRPLVLYEVHGDSMLPSYKNGALTVGWRWYRRLAVGDVVVINHDHKRKIKRIAGISAATVYVRGDNPPASTDSRHFGWLPRQQIEARILFAKRFKKTGQTLR